MSGKRKHEVHLQRDDNKVKHLFTKIMQKRENALGLCWAQGDKILVVSRVEYRNICEPELDDETCALSLVLHHHLSSSSSSLCASTPYASSSVAMMTSVDLIRR